MIITKTALPRRTVLRGAGAALSLPLLDAMAPALSGAPKPIPRMAFFYTANGLHMPSFRPKAEGPGFELPQMLGGFAPVRDQLVIVSGTSNLMASSGSVGGGPHSRASGAWLHGCRPKHTEGADVEAGTSVDQYAAEALGQDTRIRSLELAVESSYSGTCETGYSCIYVNTQSWRSPTRPNPVENNPRVVFERLFGDGGSVAAQRLQIQQDKSVLDWVAADWSRIGSKLGASDRAIVDEYLSAVRDVEHRIHKAERYAATTPLPSITQPIGVPDSAQEHLDLMLDLQFLAFQADITRVIFFQTSREQSARTYPYLGVLAGHHEVSHHANDPNKIAQLNKIDAYYIDAMGRLAAKMRNAQDGDGTLLDHAIMLWGSGMGSGDVHSPHNLPCALVGGGCGQMGPSRHIVTPMDTPFINVGLSILDKVGVHLDRIGDSTGRIAGL